MQYIIYNNDPKITNFYIYDSAKHVVEGTDKLFKQTDGDSIKFGTYHLGKNKLSRINGCLTSLNKNETKISDIIQFYKEIKLPTNNEKYVIAVNHNNKLCGLKISFKKLQQFDQQTGQVLYYGEQYMKISCQDEKWLKKHANLTQIIEDIQKKGYYCEKDMSIVKKDEISSTLNDELEF